VLRAGERLAFVSGDTNSKGGARVTAERALD